jgi:hypothetical protein
VAAGVGLAYGWIVLPDRFDLAAELGRTCAPDRAQLRRRRALKSTGLNTALAARPVEQITRCRGFIDLSEDLVVPSLP